MEIGNPEQREKDKEKNDCFKSHNVGCRSWKCNPTPMEDAKVGNTEKETENESDETVRN